MRPGRLPRAPLAALVLLAACPLPQSVPSVPPGSVTPPRIVEDATLAPPGTTTSFDPGCPTAQSFEVKASVADENFAEVVEYRWFVDYDPTIPTQPLFESGQLNPPDVEPFTIRPVPPLAFRPGFGSGGSALHVLELVVSNGFDQSADQTALPLPYRTPLTNAQNTYEVQSHKWVFVPVPGCATAATCGPCP